ncbi:MAG: class IV adenylate cyclase [Leeuwenhoekiella sp.]
MHEVELKAILKNPEQTKQRLLARDPVSFSQLKYEDFYFDRDNSLDKEEKELRLRIKTNLGSGVSKTLLTFKDSPFDAKSKSKPEFETSVEDFKNTREILLRLGYSVTASYTKNCEIFNFDYHGCEMEVALVTINGLENTYLEIETLTEDKQDIDRLFKLLHGFLSRIGITEADLTSAYYVDALRKKDW